MNSEQEIIRSLAGEWSLEPDQRIGREQVLRALALRISRMLEGQAEDFFRLMYRLDIAEHRLQAALADAHPPECIAQLVWDRQLEKILSRARYSPPETPDAELEW